MEEFTQAQQEFVGAFQSQIELKALLTEAEEKFEASKEGMPEYIDYRVLLSAYKQSKEDYKEAYNNFSEEIHNRLENKA